MDNHPIPQDVTGFQFKLIGNMTVKQFAYLATGLILAWVLYKMPIFFLIKFPFCAFFALLGTGLAYYPISGRPMDVMIGNYIKAFFRPTEFVYSKIGGKIYFPNKIQSIKTEQDEESPSQSQQDKLRAYLKTMDIKKIEKVDEKESNFLMSVVNLATAVKTAVASAGTTVTRTTVSRPTDQIKAVDQPTTANQPIIDKPDVGLAVKRTLVDQKAYIQRVDKDARQLNPNSALNLQQIHPSGAPIKIIASKEPSLDENKIVPSQSVAPASHTTPRAQKPAEPPAKQKATNSHTSWGQIKTAKFAQKEINKAKASNTPDAPNMISGNTKDARGNSLPNILIEVRDKDGNPVRAFKTNTLGRFASATPLPNGIYTVEFEDPKAQNKFEKATINVTGKVIPPIDATSVDTREELRRSLFTSSSHKN
jgi:hypothetical protein